jgi:hypothetical protein
LAGLAGINRSFDDPPPSPGWISASTFGGIGRGTCSLRDIKRKKRADSANYGNEQGDQKDSHFGSS